jgi:pullulanase-type alpha-1,6-glucosidase
LLARTLLVLLLLLLTSLVMAQEAALPESVTVAGTIQAQLGCSEDWQPSCENTFLTYDENNDIWRGSFVLTAGEYAYKAALNGSWDLNYGQGAQLGGADIPLVLEEDATVQFFFDHKTGWITDNVNSIIAVAPGSFQSELGCADTTGNAGDWEPSCFRSWLQDPDGDGIYVFETSDIPEGSYVAKVALDENWTINYGEGGAVDGADMAFDVPEDGALITFTWDSDSKELTIESGEAMAEEEGVPAPTLPESELENPEIVAIAGTLQPLMGCSGEWQTDCPDSYLTYDENNDIWRGSFDLPAGSYEYKVALDGTWAVNFGLGAQQDGPNIPLELAEEMTVEFFFDYKTGWVTDDVNSIIANVPGSFQSELGCADTTGNSGDWEPPCLITWLQDPDGDGIYVFATSDLPEGNYEAKVALNESWGVNYGANGARDGANIPFAVPADALVTFVWDSVSGVMTINVASDQPVAQGNLGLAQAHWISADTIAWDVDHEDGNVYTLYYDAAGDLSLDAAEGIVGGESITLTYNPDGMSENQAARFPQLARYETFTLPDDAIGSVPDILRGQTAIAAADADGNPLDATSLQIPGVLDDLYVYDGQLGVVWEGDVPTVRVWAPTAQSVSLHRFADVDPTTNATVDTMTRDDATGVWSVTGSADWKYQYYLFEVEVYVPSTGQVETNLVTDPYSLSLSMNSARSQIVDLSDPETMPDGWQDVAKPPLDAPEDSVIYELHVRDFSAFDTTVPQDLRGTFMAFTVMDSAGMRHLINLANAGLTHLHLLPAFDIATINEDPAERVEPDYDVMATFAPDSDQQQAMIDPIRDQDAFNWGYDPYHFNVPEGSYSTDPNGAQRILEFRSMVQSLNNVGLRVVMDVVYNHTNSAGQSERSVFDRIVPGYYHRLDERGGVMTVGCCPNFATEHTMAERFMVDSVVLWATAYKVDGFRFDLMGLHTRENMEAVRAALDDLTPETDGVDGEAIYVYGEGWDMLSGRGVQATQLNMGGVGIGTFNDRLRDAVRGGSPFSGRQDQGFVSDLFFNPNGITPGDEAAQLDQLLLFGDQIRVGLAGNLRDYSFVGADGELITGMDVLYGGAPAGYTLDPQENIVYISKHDNETIWDILMYKDLDVPIAEYVRMNNVGLSIVMYAQGVPFFQAGDDILRSKSLDRNSYNSGDWFNRLDFTMQTNNFGVGLPLAGDNQERWDIMGPLLADPDLQVTEADILAAAINFEEMLQIRSSSQLFRLETAEQVQSMLAFHNTGPDQIPGLIVMSVTDTDDIDANFDMVVVLFNASPEPVTFTRDELSGVPLELHPVLVNSADSVVQAATFDADSATFSVPARTTAVFVLPQSDM